MLKWFLGARLLVLVLAVGVASPAAAGNGVGPGGFSVEVIAYENCPAGDFTGSNRRMIAVQADYPEGGDLLWNQNGANKNELIKNNTIKLTQGEDFQVMDGNACGAKGRDGAELMLPITPDNCAGDCPVDDPTFTEYTVEVAMVGPPDSSIGVRSCAAEADGGLDVNNDGDFDDVVCSVDENVLLRTRKNGKPVWEDASPELLTVCIQIIDDDEDVIDLSGPCEERLGIFDPRLEYYFWQWNTRGRPHAKLRFHPVE